MPKIQNNQLADFGIFEFKSLGFVSSFDIRFSKFGIYTRELEYIFIANRFKHILLDYKRIAPHTGASHSRAASFARVVSNFSAI